MAVTVFKMSQLSMTMLEGIVVNWLKNEGDFVKKDEPLLEVQTDKVVMEMTSPVDGYLRKILAKTDESVPVGGSLCIIAGQNEDIGGCAEVEGGAAKGPNKPATAVKEVVPEVPAGRVRISPLAKKIAVAEGVDLAGLIGTGPDGLIVKADVQRAKADSIVTAISAPCDDDEVEIIPLRGIRKVTADQMMLSKQQTASVTTVAEVDMTSVGQLRKHVPVSYTTFVVKAAAEAIKEFAMINSSIVGEEIHIKKKININVAVGTGKSLVTPVLKCAGDKNILSISDGIDDLADRARAGKLTNEDFAGGTFTVTNSGVFGSLIFTPIINYPQCAILGIGKLMKTPIVREDEIVIANMMHLCLSYDHRIIDGENAVKFLQRVKYYLENPQELIRRKK